MGPAAAELCAGLAALAATLVGAWRFEAIDELRFPLAWAAVLAALDGAGRLKHGASALPRARDWLRCGAGSLLLWDLFEVVNLRLQNWWYVGISREYWAASVFAALSFATVLPAVRLLEALLQPSGAGPLPLSPGTGPLPLPRSAVALPLPSGDGPSPQAPRATGWGPLHLLALGVLSLVVALAWPEVGFPLAWLFLWPLAEALLSVLPPGEGAASPLQSWRAGDRGRLWRLCAVGLFLGLVWESLNWGCARGWVYTVPRFETHKLFEMPLPGYGGYLPFALECAAALALLDRLGSLWSRKAALGAGALLCGLHLLLEATAFPLSTLSHAPAVPLRELARVECAKVPRPRRCELARLSLLARLGPRNAELLGKAGVLSVEELARIDPDRLQRRLDAIGEPLHPAVVRLWVRAAQRDLR